MKTSKLIIIIFGILTIAAFVFALTNKKTEAPPQVPLDRSERTSLPSGSIVQGNKEGVYIDYSETALANANGQKVLFFHAPWCPQCRSIEKGIVPGAIPSGLTIIKVDYDSNQELRRKYGVTLQTTFVRVDERLNLIDKYVAYDEPTFESVKTNFLEKN